MPIFDYLCNECEKKIEIIEPMEKPPKECKCGGDMRKLIGAPRIIFKGSGFYAVDSRHPDIVDTLPDYENEKDKVMV
jgi:putative FmdB family regulatory protein